MSLNKEQILLKWQNSVGDKKDLIKCSFPDFLYVWKGIAENRETQEETREKNLQLIAQALMRYLENGSFENGENRNEKMYFVSIYPRNGGCLRFPYQDSSSFGKQKLSEERTAIRLFADFEKVTAYAAAINQHYSWIEEGAVIAVPAALNDSAVKMLPIEHMDRMNISDVYLEDTGYSVDITMAVKLHRQLRQREQIDFLAMCPELACSIGKLEQAQCEHQSQDIIDDMENDVLVEAIGKPIGCVIDEASYQSGIPMPMVDSVELEDGSQVRAVLCYTDWNALCEKFGPINEYYISQISWEDISDTGEYVVLNNHLMYSSQLIKAILPYTNRAWYAKQYIQYCYENFENDMTGITDAECQQILTDIIGAPKVREEFYQNLTWVENQGETGNRLNFAFPKENAVTVLGNTARDLVDSGVCNTPAAAYHVMALLANDTDGSMIDAFNRAELYR